MIVDVRLPKRKKISFVADYTPRESDCTASIDEENDMENGLLAQIPQSECNQVCNKSKRRKSHVAIFYSQVVLFLQDLCLP